MPSPGILDSSFKQLPKPLSDKEIKQGEKIRDLNTGTNSFWIVTHDWQNFSAFSLTMTVCIL